MLAFLDSLGFKHVVFWLFTHNVFTLQPPSEELVQEKPPEVEPREEQKGPRPMANVPIPGTPWSVVWTTDERSFFFNVTSRNSVWTLPEDLEDNPHVAKILDEPPWARSKEVVYPHTTHML